MEEDRRGRCLSRLRLLWLPLFMPFAPFTLFIQSLEGSLEGSPESSLKGSRNDAASSQF
jgi:hypothetical protein